MPLVHLIDEPVDPVFAHPVSNLQVPPLSAPIVSSAPTAGQGAALDSQARLPVNIAAQSIPILIADPQSPVVGQVWYRSDTSQFCVRHDASTTKRVTLA